jgi:hypothetical protein
MPPPRDSHVINLAGNQPSKEPITIPHEPEKDTVIVNIQNDNEQPAPKEETRNAFQLLISKLSHVTQGMFALNIRSLLDAKDINSTIDRMYKLSNVQSSIPENKRTVNLLYGQENPVEHFFWWSSMYYLMC